MKTAYDELGVRPNADEAAIRTAYLKAARVYHPDVNSNDSTAEEHFKRINAAHDILKNPSQRAAYDQYLRRSRQRMRRERYITIATYAGACLIGVSLAAGSVPSLRHLLSRQDLPDWRFDSPLAERNTLAPMTQDISPSQQPGGRGEEGRDEATTMPARITLPRDLDAPADERGWPSSKQPPTNPDVVGSTNEDIIVGAVRSMEMQGPVSGYADEKAKGHEGIAIASRAIEASTLTVTRASSARGLRRRRGAIHANPDRPLAWLSYTASLQSSTPRRHFAVAGPFYQMDHDHIDTRPPWFCLH
jgi:curved DNA-binding protein CbpA